MSTARSERMTVVLAVTAIGITFVAVGIFAAVTLPWQGTADAIEHLDYMYQISQGHLPAPIGHEWPVADDFVGPDARQFASAHPPLWYSIGALLVGGLLDEPTWAYAVAVLRGVDIVLGLGALITLAFAGWLLGGALRARLAVALPALGGFTFSFLRFSSEVYNDMLVTVLSLVAVLLACCLLTSGVRARLFVPLVIVCTLGMGSKATFVLTLLMCAAATVVATIIHRTGSLRAGFTRAAVATLTLFAVPGAVFGWFYWRNAILSGSWYRATPKSPVGDRVERSLLDNLTSPEFYLTVPRSILGHGSTDVAETTGIVLFVALAATTIAVIAILLLRMRSQRRIVLLLGGFLIVHLLGSYVLQLSHATGFGAYNGRYFLPSQISIALLMGAGIVTVSTGRWAAVVLPTAMAGLWVWNSISFVLYGQSRFMAGAYADDLVGTLGTLTTLTGVPLVVPVASLAVAALTTISLAVVLAARPLRAATTTAGGVGPGEVMMPENPTVDAGRPRPQSGPPANSTAR